MALSYLFDPNKQFQDKNGVNNVGGYLYVFINDSDDHAQTYCNFTGTLNPERIVLDNNGRAVVIVDELKTYRIEVYDRSGNMLWSQYPVRPTNVIYGDYNVYNADIYGTLDEIDVDEEMSASGVKKFTIKLANAVKTVIGNIQDTISSIVETVSSKADKVQGATAGNFAALDANGNLTDSGNKTADFATSAQGAKADTAIQGVKVNGTELSKDGNNKVDVPVPTASTATPLKDGTASAGSSSQWARGDHRHPTDDSREAVSNKKQVVNDSSTTEYPSSKAVADFVNSSVATNTANFLGTISESSLGLDYTATNEQIALALNVHTWVSAPTNNDYCFVSVNDPQTTDVDEYRRFKFNGSVWAYEYTLNNSSFTQAQWDAINSGLTSSDRTTYNAAVTLLNTHVGDSGIHVTSSEKNAWNAKLDNTGDVSNTTTTFTKASGDTSPMTSGRKLSAIFTAISSFFATVASHLSNTSNPHSVTAAQVGLGNVDNTSDLNKPISTAQQAALNTKQKTINIVTGAPIILDANGNMDLKISDGSFLDGLPESGYEQIGDKLYKVGLMPDGKIWMCENLDYKFEYNGSTLPIGGSGTPTTPAAWYYNNDEANYGIDGTYKCGLLYNWYAVKYLNDNKSTLLPEGWHVPTTSEWDALATAVGGASTAGTKLKAKDNSVTSNWPSSWSGTDNYGFNALPAGYYGGSFYNIGSFSILWTATESSSSRAYYRSLNAAGSMSSGTDNKYFGYSVRLVKD